MITTFISLAAWRPIVIQALVTIQASMIAPEDRTLTSTLQSRQEQSLGDPIVIYFSDNQQVFKPGEKHALPSKITVSPQFQHRDKRHTNEEFTARSHLRSQTN